MRSYLDIVKTYYNLTLATTLGSAFVLYYILKVAKKPRLCANSKFRKFLVQHLPILEERFWPTFWCFEARAQTILRALIKSTPDANYHKEFIETPDGGHIALDWQENDASPIPSSTRPTVIILPGLTGSSQESYALHFVQQVMKLGYRATVFNYRGNGGADLKTPRSYCASNTEDLAQVIDHIKSRYPEAPLMAAGISLGGMHLMNLLSRPDHGLKAGFVCGAAYDLVAASDHIELPLNRIVFNTPLTKRMVASVTRIITINYVAKVGKDCPLKAALAISSPINVFESCVTLEKWHNIFLNKHLAYNLVDSIKSIILTNYVAHSGTNSGLLAGATFCIAWHLFKSKENLEKRLNELIFNRVLANNLKENVRRYKHLFEDTVDLDHVFESKTIRDFDDRFTAKQFGYASWKEYYEDASPHHKIDKIKVPLLCLNAADDPFSPEYALPMKECSESSHVAMIVTRHGGHIGFLEGLLPRHESFMDRVFAQYVDSVFKNVDQLNEVLAS